MRTATEPRPARVLERVSLFLLAVGVTMYGVAFAGMRRLEHEAPAFDPARRVLFEGIALHARYERLSLVGLGLVVAGLGAAVGASARTAAVRRADRRAALQLLTTPSARADG